MTRLKVDPLFLGQTNASIPTIVTSLGVVLPLGIRARYVSITSDVVMTVLAVVFPPVCLACGTVEGNHSQPLCLCSACRNRLTPVKVLPCALCGKALKSNRLPAVFRCRSCWSAKSPIKQQFALWAYQPPLDSAICWQASRSTSSNSP